MSHTFSKLTFSCYFPHTLLCGSSEGSWRHSRYLLTQNHQRILDNTFRNKLSVISRYIKQKPMYKSEAHPKAPLHLRKPLCATKTLTWPIIFYIRNKFAISVFRLGLGKIGTEWCKQRDDRFPSWDKYKHFL